MLFNSNAFILGFLPITLALYYLIRRYFDLKSQFTFLFLASLFFYSYWDVRYFPLILGSILANYALARAIMAGRHRFLLPGIVFNLALLSVFKYYDFFIGNVNYVTDGSLPLLHIALPIGISFYTFQQIAFLIDARRGLVDRFDLPTYSLFVVFFPQLIAGPIVHHKEMMFQFFRRRSNRAALHLFAGGIILFGIGLAKKTIIADNLALAATPMFTRALEGAAVNFFEAWTAAFAYTFQIYFDFSGYSDMAIGLALLFGIRLPTNFNSPYKATSIVDFWRRWHMTLSRFLRDYLYVPLGGNRKGPSRRYVNLMLVMLIGGLWHGAAWTFVLWGGLHGIYLVINHGWSHLTAGWRPLPRPWGRVLSWTVTFFAVVIAWVTFRAESFDAALHLYRAMFLFNGLALPLEVQPVFAWLGLDAWQQHIDFFAENWRSDFYIGWIWIVIAAALAIAAPNSIQLMRRFRPTVDFSAIATTFSRIRRRAGTIARPSFAAPFSVRGYALKLNAPTAVLTAVLFFAALRAINSAAPTEFLYFQF